jgi:hypothetical protein
MNGCGECPETAAIRQPFGTCVGACGHETIVVLGGCRHRFRKRRRFFSRGSKADGTRAVKIWFRVEPFGFNPSVPLNGMWKCRGNSAIP